MLRTPLTKLITKPSPFRPLTLHPLPFRAMSTTAELNELIAQQGAVVRQLKTDKSPDAPAAVQNLLDLKAQLSALGGGKKDDKKAVKFTLKTPKGTKDWHPSDMLLRQKIFKTITEVFELHGGVTIDTPVFELREILSGKYGEDSKLIYDLQDQGGEICSLRYDLTVPFARFMAMNGSQYPNIKRYHIAKVYRRDQPAMSKGRMREFYQCDFDIAGTYDAMVPDAEVLAILCQVLTKLTIKDFTVKINHRKILDGLFAVCGVPTDKIRTISSAVDKLDKMAWLDVRKEMVEDKGLDGDVADRIGEYVKLKGGVELVEKLLQNATLTGNKAAKEGLADMQLLFKYLNIFGVTNKMSFDLSLARGLDYYTGLIYEAVTEGSAPPAPIAATPAVPGGPSAKPPKAAKKDAEGEAEVDESTVGVGSIAAGGRYDELVGMFSGSTGAAGRIPCVGISFGVERLFSLLAAKEKAASGESEGRGKSTEVFVMSMGGDGLLEARMQVAQELRAAGIKAEYAFKVKPKPDAQFKTAEKDAVPFVVIVSPKELEAGKVRVKPQVGKEAVEGGEVADKNGIEVERTELGAYLQRELSRGKELERIRLLSLA